MSIIKSTRKFGIEIEFSTRTVDGFEEIRNRLRIERDGSLRGLDNPGEYVSPILIGDAGEQMLIEACDILKENGAESGDPRTSVHVHLDLGKSQGTLRSLRRKPPTPITDNYLVVAISNRLKDSVNASMILRSLQGGRLPQPTSSFNNYKFNNVHYLSKGELTKAPLINYTYYWVEKDDKFSILQKILYFYTQYSVVMEDIVSNSRKFGNMYCIPLGKSYDLAEIESCRDGNALHKLWYKDRNPSGHYDDSRYHNVNLHSFWDRHGTVEIRSHGGTIDPTKILLWTRLHQTIIDKLETMNLNDIKFVDDGSKYALHKSFIQFVDDELLTSYIKRLLGYYSDISLK